MVLTNEMEVDVGWWGFQESSLKDSTFVLVFTFFLLGMLMQCWRRRYHLVAKR